jgi:hypothetical protein
VETLHNWEAGKTTPAVKHWPVIMVAWSARQPIVVSCRKITCADNNLVAIAPCLYEVGATHSQKEGRTFILLTSLYGAGCRTTAEGLGVTGAGIIISGMGVIA